ncbi:MAG TPA: hypothetical protein VM889_13810 [Candidatus Thermoplasmatota archaeon]|nr:hypothetical protein [Candidatus Thermoplasmatota archaeon]
MGLRRIALVALLILSFIPAPTHGASPPEIVMHFSGEAGEWVVLHGFLAEPTQSFTYTSVFDLSIDNGGAEPAKAFLARPALVSRLIEEDHASVLGLAANTVVATVAPHEKDSIAATWWTRSNTADSYHVGWAFAAGASAPWTLSLRIIPEKALGPVTVVRGHGLAFASAHARTEDVGVGMGLSRLDLAFNVPSRGWTHVEMDETVDGIALRTQVVLRQAEFPNGYQHYEVGPELAPGRTAIGAFGNEAGDLFASYAGVGALRTSVVTLVHVPIDHGAWPPTWTLANYRCGSTTYLMYCANAFEV